MHSGQANLWPVSPDHAELGRGVSFSLSGAVPDCQSLPYDVIASGGRLVIYRQFGLKAAGDACTVPGGFVFADPVTGAVTDRFASDLTFRQIVPGAGGRYLYGLDAGSPAWQRVRIVKIDARTGQVIAEKSVDPDVWYLTTGSIPDEMHGRLDLVAIR